MRKALLSPRFTLAEKLQGFVGQWKGFKAREQAGAQSFLGNLLDVYDVAFEPGKIFEQHPIRIKRIVRKKGSQGLLFPEEETKYTAERMDMYIPKICIWEMKGPDQTNLQEHHDQILGYWARMRPRYMVLCNFKEFWIYDTDEEGGQNQPKIRFTIDELPEYAETLLFLRGEESHFPRRAERVTMDMASRIGRLVREVAEGGGRDGLDRERITKFALECVFAMFAEDTELFPRGLFSSALEAALEKDSLDPVYSLFDDLGNADFSSKVQQHAPYVNGSLYDRRHPRLKLAKDQIEVLLMAAREFDWQDVRPEIFGSIFEQALDPADRHELGAHFTREEDILKVVDPTVLEPWRRRIQAIRTPKDAEAAIDSMKEFHVLDPACGCGNFLYVVYREMKRLEAALRDKWATAYRLKGVRRWSIPAPPPGPYFTLYQLHGIEINAFASELARAVLWIGEYLAKWELDLEEETLPLKDLKQVIANEDALLTPWPRPEGEMAIVGNPPYLGVRKMRLELGDAYVENLFRLYPDNRAADYVTYWFPNALGVLRPGERAGFVTTNSIAQNESREASIDKVIDKGGTLVDVWKSYPWPGEAAVHVSIVNWTMEKYEGIRLLDGEEVSAITPCFTDAIDVTRAKVIPKNEKIAIVGIQPGNVEFQIEEPDRDKIIQIDPKSSEVIKPFIIGRDLNRKIDQSPSKWLIDFALMDKPEAEKYKGAFRFVQRNVYPIRTENRRESYAKYWWRAQEPRRQMRENLMGKERYLAISRVTPHLYFTFVEGDVLADTSIVTVALSTYYHFGILQSRMHEAWTWAQCSTFEERLRYTATTIFETFPFPYLPDGTYNPRKIPAGKAATAVEKAAKALDERRKKLCKELKLGLTKVYNKMKAGELPELQDLHDKLNDAVNTCYGWPEGAWRDENEVLKRLLDMNKALTDW
jgi:type I restriction-modification system DNA methylase subunit